MAFYLLQIYGLHLLNKYWHLQWVLLFLRYAHSCRIFFSSHRVRNRIIVTIINVVLMLNTHLRQRLIFTKFHPVFTRHLCLRYEDLQIITYLSFLVSILVCINLLGFDIFFDYLP